MTTHPDALVDMAYTLNTKREVHPFRGFCVTDGLDAFKLSRVAKPAPSAGRNLIFVFTGQGAQWARMGCELFENEPVFKKTVDELEAALAQLPHGPKWSLRSRLTPIHSGHIPFTIHFGPSLVDGSA